MARPLRRLRYEAKNAGKKFVIKLKNKMLCETLKVKVEKTK